jgi:mannose-6-phosphate isomerase-like protein (cupin superfamily)
MLPRKKGNAMNKAMTLVGALAMAIPAAALHGDKAEIISAQRVQAQLAQYLPLAKEQGSSGATLASYGNLTLSLSVRTSTGYAEVHAHFDDLMIVQQGRATLITGGTLIEPKLGDNGETRGASIESGIAQTVSAGDVVIVPAGMPHQLVISPDTVYSALVAKIKEP